MAKRPKLTAVFYGTFDPVYIDGRKWWMDQKSNGDPFGVRVYIDGKFKVDYCPPHRFPTDMASTRCVRRLFPQVGDGKYGQYAQSTVIHDLLCKLAKNYAQRRWADWVFRACNIANKVSRWRRALMYPAVRMAGWWEWRRRRHV